MNGLYFYKLVSPYTEDVTKECKLTVNEIDHNFVTLKDADIKEVTFDKSTYVLALVKNNGDKLTLDLASLLSGMTTNLEVDYDSIDGVITITHNGERAVIDGLVTEDNLSSTVLTEVISDGTLFGRGSKNSPLGIASVEKTGTYKPAIKFIDVLNGEFMPKPCHLKKGDRYVTRNAVSDYGYLYNYEAVKRIEADLKNGWRIPTKEDWDNMLNAIEPCGEFRNHDSATANLMLGKIAGKILKALNFWKETDDCVSLTCACNDEASDDEEFDVDFGVKTKPNAKKISPKGVDSLGMRLLPSGYHDGCELGDYFGKRGYYWTNTQINESDVYIKRFDYNKAGVVQTVESPRSFFSLRLVKDYDGTNHQQVEFINGMNYNTIMLPSLNTEHGYSIWTSDNIAFPNEKYKPLEPNNGIGLSSRIVYYINEWNGFDWEKKEMHEGESIVLLNGLDKFKNVEYRIIDGKLVSVTKKLYDEIMGEIGEQIDDINDKIGSGYTDASGNVISITEVIGDPLYDDEGNLVPITDKIREMDEVLGSGFTDADGNVISVTEVLADEIEDRIAGDERLQEELDIESAAREAADELLAEAISAETAAREYADSLLDEKIEQEIDRAISAETALAEAIALETEERKAQDDVIEASVGLDEDGNYVPTEGNYTSSATTIAEAIDALDAALKNEEEERKEEMEGLKEAIEQEREERIEADKALQHEIDVIEGSVGLDEDGNYIPTEGYYTSNATTIAEAIEDVDAALKHEEGERLAKDKELADTIEAVSGALQSEIDTMEASVGLDEDGNYVPIEGNYTSSATTIAEAIDDLDSALKNEEEERIEADNILADTIEIVSGALQTEIDTIEDAVGLDTEGKYIPTDGNYTSDATTIAEAIDDLDSALKNEEGERIAKDDYLFSRLVKEGEQPENSYDCANGVLTLYTEDDSHNITIKLNGDYGEIPYVEYDKD